MKGCRFSAVFLCHWAFQAKKALKKDLKNTVSIKNLIYLSTFKKSNNFQNEQI